MSMEKYQKDDSKRSSEVFTALRDIIDVLYNGYCKVLQDEELYNTVQKKLRELNKCPLRERRYKMLKIASIIANLQPSDDQSLESDAIDQIHNLCMELLKGLED